MKNKNLLSVILLLASTFLIGVLSYAYHPIIIRYLDLKEFAEFESLIGIINLLGVIATAISLFLVKEFSKDIENKKTNILLKLSFKIGLILAVGFYFLFLILTPFIAKFLHIESYLIIFLTGFTLFLSFFGLYQGVFLQSKKYFKFISLIGILNPIFRVSIGFLLVYIGFNIYGAIGGFIISSILLLIIGYFFIKKQISKFKNNDLENEKNIEKQIIKDFKSQKSQIFQFFLSSIILAFLMNIDILFAKNLFEAKTAGIYAGISIIAKFLVFVGMSIETVYYPILTGEKILNKKKVFILSSLYFILTAGVLGFFYLFGEKILHLFKPGFEQYLDLLYLIIIYCGALALLNFIVKILIAFNKYLLNYILVFFIFVSIVFLYKFVGNSMYSMINIFNIMIGISLLSSFLYLGLVKNEKT